MSFSQIAINYHDELYYYLLGRASDAPTGGQRVFSDEKMNPKEQHHFTMLWSQNDLNRLLDLLVSQRRIKLISRRPLVVEFPDDATRRQHLLDLLHKRGPMPWSDKTMAELQDATYSQADWLQPVLLDLAAGDKIAIGGGTIKAVGPAPAKGGK